MLFSGSAVLGSGKWWQCLSEFSFTGEERKTETACFLFHSLFVLKQPICVKKMKKTSILEVLELTSAFDQHKEKKILKQK